MPANRTKSPNGANVGTGAFGVTDLWILLMALIWGANFSVIKYAIEDLKPLAFTALRFVIASVAMLVLVKARGSGLAVAAGDKMSLFILALLTHVAYQVFFMVGMAHTRAGNAALILATTPLVTAVIGRFRGQERFTTRGVIGLLLAFVGMVLIILSSEKRPGGEGSLLGDGLLVGATICWAVYTTYAHRLVHVYGSLKATTVMMLMGTPMLLLVSAPSLVEQQWSTVRTLSWVGVVYSGLLSIALAYIIWNYGVRRIGGTRTAVYSNMTPVFAMTVAWAALGDAPTLGQLAGAAVIFLGIYLVRGGMIHTVPSAEEEAQIEEVSLGAGKN
jgi:drug/metabolite transporter (DMT)-like permease